MMQTIDLPPFHPLSCIPPTAAEQEDIQGGEEVLGEILSLSEEAFLARASFCVGKEEIRSEVEPRNCCYCLCSATHDDITDLVVSGSKDGRGVARNNLVNYITTFLHYAPRYYELMVEEEKWNENDLWFISYTHLLQRSRQILLRIPPEVIRSTFSIPALLDACALWGGGGVEGRRGRGDTYSYSTITEELDELMRRLGKGFVGSGMREVAHHAATSLSELCRNVINCKGGRTNQMTALDIIDFSLYVTDALTSLSWLLSCQSVSSDVAFVLFHEATFLPALSSIYDIVIPALEKGALSVEPPLHPYLSVLKEARKGGLMLCYLIYDGMRAQGCSADEVFNAVLSLRHDDWAGGLLSDFVACFQLSPLFTYLLDGDSERSDYLRSFVSTSFEPSKQHAFKYPPECVDGNGIGLASSTTVPPTAATSGVGVSTTQSNNVPPSKDDVTRMIQDIQAVVGTPGSEYPLGVGSGYAEALLATMGWSVERALEALLEGNIPELLRDVPRSLERAWKGHSGVNDKGYQRDENANRITLQRAKAAELEEEKNEYILENACGGAILDTTADHQNDERINECEREYDDDYNDVYDEYEPRNVEAAGTGLGGVEVMLQYNRAVRMAEEETEFWEGMTNMNRNPEMDLNREGSVQLLPTSVENKPASSLTGLAARNEANSVKKKNLKSGCPTDNSTTEAMTKDGSSTSKTKLAIQRKKKEKNKAATANHHRKDRASRKRAF